MTYKRQKPIRQISRDERKELVKWAKQELKDLGGDPPVDGTIVSGQADVLEGLIEHRPVFEVFLGDIDAPTRVVLCENAADAAIVADRLAARGNRAWVMPRSLFRSPQAYGEEPIR